MMIATATKCVRAGLVISWLMIGTSAIAEEVEFYESLADVEIGRVFLSPEQRAALDARRGEARPVAMQNRPVGKAAVTQSPDAAGYIVSSSGRSRIWSKGGIPKGRGLSTRSGFSIGAVSDGGWGLARRMIASHGG